MVTIKIRIMKEVKLNRTARYYPWVLSGRELQLLYKYPLYNILLQVKKFWITLTNPLTTDKD